MNKLESLISSMLKTNTGIHMMDSGGATGRAWQRNADRNFESEPSATFEPITDEVQSDEISLTVSTYHYLTGSAEIALDELCDEFNALPCKDWESDIYGVSKAQAQWLKKHGLKPIYDSFNTYNSAGGESMLDQVLQGTWLQLHDSDCRDYVLLQSHNGADVRGGYTDAKLFVSKSDDVMHTPIVSGEIDGQSVSTDYSPYGTTLVDDDGKPVPVNKNSKIEVSLFPN